MNARLTFVHALSPLHAGTGQGSGIIDLPVAREKATGLPFFPGSSLKGALRNRCEDQENCKKVFGPDMSETSENDGYASSVQFSDQRLLLLPIRSLAGTFAWVTSPYFLWRLLRDIEYAQIAAPTVPPPDIQDVENCLITDVSKIKLKTDGEHVYLEDLDLKVSAPTDKSASIWANWIGEHIFPDNSSNKENEKNNKLWREMLVERMCIVHDDVFNFLIDTSTEITARIKLQDQAKTVQQGGLWYEEALPTETILSGIVLASPTKAAGIKAPEVFKILQELTNKTVQFGGKATVGRGMCRVQFSRETPKGGA